MSQVDRGGLDYNIQVGGNFAGALPLARAQLAAVFDQIRKNEAAAATFAKTMEATAAAVQQATAAAQASVAASKAQNTQTKEAAKVVGIATAAQRKYAKAVQDAGVAREFARISEARSYRLQQQTLSQQQARAKAEADLTRLLNKRLLSEQKRIALSQRGTALSFSELKAYGLLTKSQEKLAKASEKTNQAVKDLNDENLRAIRIAGIRAKAESKARDIAALKALGLGPTGAPIPAPVVKPAKVELTPEQQGQANAIKRLNDLRQQSIDRQALEQEIQKRGIKLTKDQKRELGLITAEQERFTRSGRGLIRTLARIAGTIVAYAAFRNLISTFKSIVAEVIEFNARIETAQLGIASLLTAVADVRDASGQTVDSVRALALAQEEARRQTSLLRRDALQTAATFDDLVQAFQTAVAPGFQAGFDIDQIRRFTVQISQAATAIGLESNQLAEEIRSILQGTIQPRQTRIATALGITNEDIRNAREAGVLFEFLQERFTAFTVAGQESLKTYRALYTNLQDAFRLLFSEGGEIFFNELKAGLKDLFDAITDVDPITGLLSPDPRALKAVQEIAKGLSLALQEARALGNSLGFDGLAGAGRAFGEAIATAARIFRGVIQGLLLAVQDVSSVIEAITGISPFNNSELGETVALFTRIAALVFVINTTVVPVVTTLVAWGAAIAGAGAPALILAATLIACAAAAAGLTEGFRLFVKEVDGVDLTSLQSARLLLASIVERILSLNIAIGSIIARAGALQAAIVYGVIGQITKGLSRVIRGIRIVIEGINEANKALGLPAIYPNSLIKLLSDGELSLRGFSKFANAASQAGVTLSNTIGTLTNGLQHFLRVAAERQRIEILSDDRSISKYLNDQITELRNTIAPKIRQMFDDLGTGPAAASNLSEIFRGLPPVISKASDALSEGSERVRELRDAAVEANDALQESLATIGIQGSVSAQIGLLLKGQVDKRESLKKLAEEEKTIEQESLGLLLEKSRFEARLAQLSQDQNDLVSRGVALAKQTFDLDSKTSQVKSAIALAEAKLRKAAQDGATEEYDTLLQSLQAEKDKLATLQQQTKELDAASNALLEGIKPGEAQAIVALISKRIQIEGQEADIQARSNSLAEDRRRAEGLITQAVEARIRAAAAEANFNLSRDNAEARLEAETRRAEIAAVNADTETKALVQAQNELKVLELRASQAQELRNIQIAALENLRSQLTDSEAILAVEQQLVLLREQNQILSGAEAANIAEQRRLVNEAAIRAGNDTGAQINLALTQLERELPSRFQSILDFLSTSISSFSDFITQTIVDAFDPNAKGDIGERFGRFLQGLATQIISTLVQIAVTRAALGLSGIFVFSGGGEVPAFRHGGAVRDQIRGRRAAILSRAKGGDVPHSAARPSMRPRGVPASDTVPAMLTPGEFVHRVEAVRTYGLDVMEKINAAAIDPTSLRSLAANTKTRARRGRRTAPLAFKDGGPVPAGASGGGGGSGPSPAYIVANERTMDTLLSSGGAAMRRWLADNGFVQRG